MKQVFSQKCTSNYFKLASLCCVLFFIVGTNHAHATEGYAVSPLIIDTELSARDIIVKKVTLKNNSNEYLTIYPTVNNIRQSDSGAIEEFLPPVASDQTRSLASWIEISRLGIDLKPGDEVTVDLTFHVNPNPIPGTYHALVGFASGQNRDDATRKIEANQGPGVLVSVTIKDTRKEELRLSKFIVSRFITKADNEAALYSFTNSGDETVVPKGEIIIYNSSGEEIATIPVNADNTTIAPTNNHTFSSRIPVAGLFGKYKAFLTVEYGTKQRAVVNDTSFFYVFPIKIIIIVMSILGAVTIFFAWFFHRRYIETTSDDSHRLTLKIKDGTSASKHHDIDLTANEKKEHEI